MLEGITIFSPDSEVNNLILESFARQDELDKTSKFHPGERVRITADICQLVDALKGATNSEVDAYLVAREIIQTDGTIFSASLLSENSDSNLRTYYTVEYNIYGINQYYVLPEEFLELR